MSLWPFSRRKPFTASRMAAAVHRSTICPPRHRLTFRFTCRVRLIRLSIALVVASDCRRRSERPSVRTVSVSSRPSRTLAAALGYRSSSRRARSCSSRRAGRDLGLLVGARDDRADPGPLSLRKMLQDIAQLVHLTAVDQGRGAKRLRHGFVQRLRAIEDDQEAAVGAQAAALQIGEEALTHRRILRRAVPEAERVFAPVVVDAERDDDAVLADVDAVDQQRHQVERVRAAVDRQAASCAAVFATNRRLTALLLVPRRAHLGAAPAPGCAHTAASRRRRASARRRDDSADRCRPSPRNVGSADLAGRRRARAAGESAPSGRRGRPHSATVPARDAAARPDADTAGRRSPSDPSSSIVVKDLQARRDGELHQLGSRIDEEIDERADGAGGGFDLVRPIDCARLSFHGGSLLAGFRPGLSHRSYTTTSEEPPLSNFNSYRDIPGSASAIDKDCDPVGETQTPIATGPHLV